MRNLRILGLLLLGGVAGASVVIATEPVRAQAGSRQRVVQRLVVTGSRYESVDAFGTRLPPKDYDGNFAFIKDVKSGRAGWSFTMAREAPWRLRRLRRVSRPTIDIARIARVWR